MKFNLIKLPDSDAGQLKKFYLVMKLTWLLILAICLQSTASVWSQTTSISLKSNNTSLQELFINIENQTGYRFFYNNDEVDVSQKVTVNISEKPIGEILTQAFKNLPYSFRELENKLILVERSSSQKGGSDLQQQKTITGKVTDSSGAPLPGVTIVIKGTIQGTVTDSDGSYSLANVPGDGTLVFSFVGMRMQEAAVEGKSVINAVLEEDTIGLEEVVAVGYGTMKRSDITGSVASVKSEKLEEMPVSRVDQALQGQLSGVTVQNTSAEPNAKVTIRIRGANSINGDNSPLVVVDGFQGGDLNTLVPNDIESIEVLKDASATAIYGSRGANGVILITTKSGKKGKTIISYNSYYSIHQTRKKIDVMDAAQYAQVVNENRIEFDQNPVFSEAEIAEFTRTGGTNWQDEIFRNAFSHNQLLSIRGGNENLIYYLSGGIVDMEGIILNTSYSRYNIRSNITSQINDKIKVDLNIYLSREEDHPTAQHTYGGTNIGSPMYSAMVFAPTKPVYDEDGNYSMPGGGYGPPTNYNPVALAKEPIRDHYMNTANVNLGGEYNLAKGLILSISGGYRLFDYEYNQYFNSIPNGNTGSEEAIIMNGKQITMQNTNMITYNKLINDAHNLTFTGVFEQQVEKYNASQAESKGFFTNSVTYNNLGLGDNPQIPSSSAWKRSLESFMVRINYSYKSKYLLTLTGRADASSVFGKNNKWGYFPSVALGWNVSSENFMSNIQNVVSHFKLRTSFGVTGNQAISPYKTLGLLNTNSPYPIDGSTLSVGASLGDIANPDLEWEKTEQLNIGTDLKFFEGRVELIADYYNKKTKDLLLIVPLPVASGGKANVLRNVGEVENKGFELYLGGKPIDGEFKWQTGITFGKNKNEVVALRGDETSYALGDAGLPGFGNARWLEVGQPLGLYKGYEQAAIWKSSEVPEAAVYGAFPGAPKFVDQNNDDEINSEDIIPIANAQPDFTYGWSNTFTYKNFDLNILIQGVSGNDILNLGRVRMEVSNGDSDATSPRILDRWTQNNEDTDVPSFTGQNAFTTQATNRWVEDGSYLRVKDITLGYNFPELLMQKLKIKSARIYVSGSNLFTITNYSGYDPEASSGVDRYGGVDVGAYPSQKIYTIGLNLKF